jgi:hypothetical protein
MPPSVRHSKRSWPLLLPFLLLGLLILRLPVLLCIVAAVVLVVLLLGLLLVLLLLLGLLYGLVVGFELAVANLGRCERLCLATYKPNRSLETDPGHVVSSFPLLLSLLLPLLLRLEGGR